MTLTRYEEASRIVEKQRKINACIRHIDSLSNYKKPLYVTAEGGFKVDIPKEIAEGLFKSLRAFYSLEEERLNYKFKNI